MSAISPIVLVYDGECPICSAYCKALAIRQLESRFEIVNARQYHPVLENIKERGLDLEEGFVLKIENDYFHGADAINRLALITTRVRPVQSFELSHFQVSISFQNPVSVPANWQKHPFVFIGHKEDG